MEWLNEMEERENSIGRLAVKDKEDEDATVYVVWEIGEDKNFIRLVELDSPADGENHFVDLNKESVYLLEPIEVVERVVEWK